MYLVMKIVWMITISLLTPFSVFFLGGGGHSYKSLIFETCNFMKIDLSSLM